MAIDPRPKASTGATTRVLKHLRVGVQLVGNDLAATPVGHALAMNGHINNVRGFTIYGEGPASPRMIAAIADQTLDVALLWGRRPAISVRARRRRSCAWRERPQASPTFRSNSTSPWMIAAATSALRDELDGILERRRTDIDAILAAYSAPRTDGQGEGRP